ncbi:EAL domain-containing protein [Marinomonas sp. PE14-40]|uniref:bifunctional diguanylate cyclase/phosphodiesterase n=1 Tax=Marinomonas sp. PE14-40 TaxID=3060621 RepID=UPI003F67DC66
MRDYVRQLLLSPLRIFYVLLLVGAVTSFFVLKQVEALAYEGHKASALALGQNHAALINTTIANNMSANYALAAMVKETNGDLSFFDSYAKSLHQIYPVVSHFTLSPNGIIKLVYPMAGNEASVGLNQLKFKQQQEEANKARTSRQLTLAGPVKMVQGGVAIIGRWPVLLPNAKGENTFWGFTNVAVTLDALLNKANFQELSQQGYEYRLVKLLAQQEVLITDSSAVDFNDSVNIDIKVPNDVWQLQLMPVSGWSSWFGLKGEILMTALISLLIAGLVGLLRHIYISKQGLEEVVKQRTQDMSHVNKRLLGLLEAIPDLLLEIDDKGEVLHCHFPNKLLASQFGPEIVGRNLMELFPLEAVSVYKNSFEEAQDKGYSEGNSFCLELGESEYWFELSVSFTERVEENRPCFVALARDVSRRKKSENELRIAATAFNTQDGILITDMQHKIVRVNKAFQRITGYQETEIINEDIRILRSGRHDDAFFRKIYNHLDEFGYWEGEVWNRKKCGEIAPELTTISIVYSDENLPLYYVFIIKDISLTKQNEQMINQLSFYDSLTCLPNRKMISEKVEQLIHQAQFVTEEVSVEGHYAPLMRHALLFIDLDHFKNINDSKGHSVGDKLLQQVALRLVDVVRKTDMVARFGGDEFIILLEGVDISFDPGRALYRAKRVSANLNDAISRTFEINGDHFYISSSIGITEIDDSINEVFDAFKHAELAMYEAKSTGRNRYCFYSPQMQEKILQRVNLEAAMREALDRKEFILHYQPQFDRSGSMRGVEALIRWMHPEDGVISPAQFIPLAEESKLIIPIGEWVVRDACQTLAKWQKDPALKLVKMSVNVSALQFSQDDFVELVELILEETGAQAKLLQFELTESMLINDKMNILEKMHALKKLGVLLSLDDFGTGYSSLSYLQQLPFDQLKIDQSFVKNLSGHGDHHPLALTITTMGHSLGLEVIAEGIETNDHLLMLQRFGCDLFQGYFMGYPMMLKEIERISHEQANQPKM